MLYCYHEQEIMSMQLIRVTSKRKEILKYTKKLGLYGLYKDVKNAHDKSVCHLIFDPLDYTFKVLVDQSRVPYEYQDECIRDL